MQSRFCRPRGHAGNETVVRTLPRWLCRAVVTALSSAHLIAPAYGQPALAASCEGLSRLVLPNTTIAMAETVAAGDLKTAPQVGEPPVQAAPTPGGWTIPEGMTIQVQSQQGPNPAICRVIAMARPTNDSQITIEVWLPLDDWNGKFLGVGNIGFGGQIMYGGMLQGVQRGYAAASTDTGHPGATRDLSGSFIPGHPEKLIDYGYRAVHLMTVRGKEIVRAFYGTPPKHSLFVGCSLGGMQALQEAYRFPEDFDGIIAGAPANPMTTFNAMQMWPTILVSRNPEKALPAGKVPVIREAVLKACAGPIGLEQGFVEQSHRCRFDPRVLLCKDADGPDCLTVPQAELLRQVYAGPVNPRTGESIFPGPPPGAEAKSGYQAGATPLGAALSLYKYAVYQDPNWDWKTLDFDTSVALARERVDPYLRAADDLTAFLDHGGKLMLYVGGEEQHNPLELIGYQERVLANNGERALADSVRLFIIPGMGHCYGGAGCDRFDKLGTMDKWVESGKAPDEMLCSKVSDGQLTRTALVCAYPSVAKYKGTGDTDDARSFVCAPE